MPSGQERATAVLRMANWSGLSFDTSCYSHDAVVMLNHRWLNQWPNRNQALLEVDVRAIIDGPYSIILNTEKKPWLLELTWALLSL